MTSIQEGTAGANVVIRPSKAQYRSTFPDRMRRSRVLLIATLPTVVGYAAGAVAFARGNAVLIVLAAAGLVAVLLFGVIAFLIDLLYLTRVRLEIAPGWGWIARSGFPFRARRASVVSLRAIVGRKVDYGVGIIQPAWFLVDQSGNCPCWFAADFWKRAEMLRLVDALGGTVGESTEAPIPRNAISSVFLGSAQRW
jgi:hypothetical protein